MRAHVNFDTLHPAEQIVLIMDRIYRQGMTTTSGGNLSIREETGDLWITPRAVDKGSLTPRDIVHVSPDGKIAGRHPPSVELPFHQLIYRRRPDLRALVHAHPSGLVAFSLVRKIPDTSLVPGMRLDCGAAVMAEYGLPGSAELGERIAAAFGEGSDAVMLENHGAVTGGRDLLQAYMVFETMEFCARLEIEARRIGTPSGLGEEELRRATRTQEAGLEEFEPGPPDSEERRAREEMVAMARRACDQELFTSAHGNLSLRLDGGAFLVTPANLDRRALEAGDLVRVEGSRREAGKVPSRTVRLHQAIHARHPHIRSLITAHPPSIMAFAVTAEQFDTRTIPECYIMLRDVPKLPFGATYRDPEQAAAAFDGGTHLALVQNECLIATGESLLQAFDRLEVAEFSARALVACRVLGERFPIGEAQIDELRRAFPVYTTHRPTSS